MTTQLRARVRRVSDAGGSLEVLEIEDRPLSKSMLCSDDAYILDSNCDVFVWIGKGANGIEKTAGLKCAEVSGARAARGAGDGQRVQHFFEVGERSDFSSITRVVEGAETYLFKVCEARRARRRCASHALLCLCCTRRRTLRIGLPRCWHQNQQPPRRARARHACARSRLTTPSCTPTSARRRATLATMEQER